jgi:hypothetical protein
MGSFEARRGAWGLFTDVVYMDVGGSKSDYREFTVGGVPLPGGANAHVDYDLKGWVWTLQRLESGSCSRAGPAGRCAPAKRVAELDIAAMSVRCRYRNGQDFKVGLSNWDAIVGLKGPAALAAASGSPVLRRHRPAIPTSWRSRAASATRSSGAMWWPPGATSTTT